MAIVKSNNNGGDSNTSGLDSVLHDYKKKGESQGFCIDDKLMEEIATRLISKVDRDEVPNERIVKSEIEPSDTSVLWQEIDETGKVIAPIKRYDPDTGEWIEDKPDQQIDEYVPPKRQCGLIRTLGDGQITVPFIALTMDDLEYDVSFTVTTTDGSAFPLFDNGEPRIVLVGRNNIDFVVNITNVPSNGISYLWRATECVEPS